MVSLSSQYYLDGYEKIYPFVSYRDYRTHFVRRYYLIDASEYKPKEPLVEIGLDIPQADRVSNGEVLKLINQTPIAEPPMRLRVEEIYGAIPPEHFEPSAVAFTFPAWEAGGSGQNLGTLRSASLSGDLLSLRVDDASAVNVADLLGLFRKESRIIRQDLGGGFIRTVTLSSGTVLYGAVRTVDNNTVGVSAPTQEREGFQQIMLTPEALNDLFEDPSNYTLALVKRIRSTNTRIAPAQLTREYFYVVDRTDIPNPEPAFAIRDDQGEETDTLTPTSVPSYEDYQNMDTIVPFDSQFEQVEGNLWVKITPTVPAL